MRIVDTAVAFLLFASAATSGHAQTSVLLSSQPGPVRESLRLCSDDNLQTHHDGSFEAAIAWEADGVAPPYYGAFGEGYDLGPGAIDCVSLWLCQSMPYQGQATDVYAWEGGTSGDPGAVLAMVTGMVFQNIPTWPESGRFDVELAVTITGDFTVGLWGDWPGSLLGYYLTVDRDGTPGHPWTFIAPDMGWPEGWQNPSLPWGFNMQSMGIGVHFSPDPTPASSTSWGHVKQLYVGARN